MIAPALRDAALLDDVSRAAAAEPHSLHLWWLGQSGFLVQWHNRHLLLDPYLSDSLTDKYASTDKPHVRLSERVIAPDKLNFIDVVTSSHNHTDHLDPGTLRPLLAANPQISILVPLASVSFAAQRLSVSPERLRGIDAGGTTELAGFKFHAVPAAHPGLDRDAQGHHLFLGYVIECGPWKIYHSGDTLRFPGHQEWLKNFSIDVALLPINGDRPERRVAGNLDGPQAARLAREIGAQLCIPCHYDMFEFNTATPDEFVREAQTLNQSVQVLRQGQRQSFRR
jgi:L-ascorbate metabolism protein UlaG (beta-lactamase superfamily)